VNVCAVLSSSGPLSLSPAQRKEQYIQSKKSAECALKWLTAREECVVHFWSSYYAYIRYTKQHIFQFPLKRALALIKAKRWEAAEVILRPFSPLRPLVILIAWDLVRTHPTPHPRPPPVCCTCACLRLRL
jgi:hypothetical protein